MDPRRVLCSGVACTKSALIPKNRSRPNKWNSEYRSEGLPSERIRYYCPECYTAKFNAEQKALVDRKAAEAQAIADKALAEEAERAEEGRLAAEAYAKLPEGFASWAPEVIADSSGKWCGNALRFTTRKEADENVLDLSYRWMLVRETRTVPSKDPVNYRYGPKGLIPV